MRQELLDRDARLLRLLLAITGQGGQVLRHGIVEGECVPIGELQRRDREEDPREGPGPIARARLGRLALARIRVAPTACEDGLRAHVDDDREPVQIAGERPGRDGVDRLGVVLLPGAGEQRRRDQRAGSEVLGLHDILPG